jgi:apolipoprotein N-acyltransferase
VLVRVALAVLAGLSLSLAFEPVAFPWVIPPAVAAFALLTRGLRPRRAFVVGLALGAAFYATHIF